MAKFKNRTIIFFFKWQREKWKKELFAFFLYYSFLLLFGTAFLIEGREEKKVGGGTGCSKNGEEGFGKVPGFCGLWEHEIWLIFANCSCLPFFWFDNNNHNPGTIAWILCWESTKGVFAFRVLGSIFMKYKGCV